MVSALFNSFIGILNIRATKNTKKLKIGILFKNLQQIFQLTTPDESTACIFTSGTHPKCRLLHSKFLSALFKQKSEGLHFWFLQFGSF